MHSAPVRRASHPLTRQTCGQSTALAEHELAHVLPRPQFADMLRGQDSDGRQTHTSIDFLANSEITPVLAGELPSTGRSPVLRARTIGSLRVTRRAGPTAVRQRAPKGVRSQMPVLGQVLASTPGRIRTRVPPVRTGESAQACNRHRNCRAFFGGCAA